jgi:hypothetical protein
MGDRQCSLVKDMKKQNITLPDIFAAVHAVADDADKCKEIMLAEKTQFARRNWVRAYFAWIEATCFLFRRSILAKRFEKRVIRPTDIPEFTALSEVRYTVTGKGEAIVEPANTRTLDYIVFSLMSLSKTFGLKLSIDRGGKNWESVRRALQVRDRLTHPKSLHDVHVSDDDIAAVEDFSGWFSAHLTVITNDTIRTKVKKESAVSKRTKKRRKLVIDMGDL